MTVQLHLSLGPVQGFIAEARRTRDLWVGSYLLSHLAGRALAAAKVHAERIVLPAIDDRVLALYADDPDPTRTQLEQLPAHASLPNRFVLVCADDERAAQAGRAAAAAVEATWRAVADAVRERHLDPVSRLGHGSADIWRRQVDHFWELCWVIGDDPALLDQRKHWRATARPPEPGDHCTVMGRYQELSGHLRRHGDERQDKFWQELRDTLRRPGGSGISLDLRADERLCAPALIKRLLPLYAQEALGRALDDDTARWPSTLYMAAYPWIEQVCAAAPEAAAAYADHVRRARAGACGERAAGAELSAAHPEAGRFPTLDGNFFFVSAIKNPRDTPLDHESTRAELAQSLRTLQRRVGAASPYVAFLLMDGDRMGDLLRRAASPELVTRALSDFARAVPGHIERRQGATVYAGGDDVLALVPIDRALPAALDLAAAYARCFADAGLAPELLPSATLSGAILYAHYRLPLRRLLALAHDLLADVAKADTGRAAVALSVHRPSGETARWSAPWAYLRAGDGTCLDPLVEHLRAGALGKSVVYRLRERFGRLLDTGPLGPGRHLSIAGLLPAEGLTHGDRLAHADALLRDLVAAEIHNDRTRAERSPDDVSALAADLITACRRVRTAAPGHGGPGYLIAPDLISFDGVHLAHFLATGGRDDER
ncbi:type III-B CRISPR-associated protein Cas10/Cmr2 [Haliangium sp.]|uniref:type III-B CRISPR-associated protein Cas10/Cmr2 n=1 Tax=Haliangium sp. TaxID=2663208 RepID=UPI003D14BE46